MKVFEVASTPTMVKTRYGQQKLNKKVLFRIDNHQFYQHSSWVNNFFLQHTQPHSVYFCQQLSVVFKIQNKTKSTCIRSFHCTYHPFQDIFILYTNIFKIKIFQKIIVISSTIILQPLLQILLQFILASARSALCI